MRRLLHAYGLGEGRDEMKTIDKLAEVLRHILDATAQCDGYEVCQQDDFSEAREVLAAYEAEKQTEETDPQRLDRIKTFLKARYGRKLSDVHDDMEFLVEQIEMKDGLMPPDGHAGQMEDLGFRKRVLTERIK